MFISFWEPTMVLTRSDVYRLLADSFYIRSGVGKTPECGHSLLYRPHKGFIRKVLPERKDTLLAHQEEMLEGLGLTSFPIAQDWENILPIGHDRIIFEGFGINPDSEMPPGSIAGLSPIGLNSPQLWRMWSHKPTFLQKVRQLFGEAAVPRFQYWEDLPSPDEVWTSIQTFFKDGSTKVVLKGSGAGGFGNITLTQETPIAMVQTFLENKFDPSSTWVSLEEWVHWEVSPCTSFFCLDSQVVALEMCEQVLTPKSGGFIGGKSYSSVLSDADKAELYRIQKRLARDIADSGIHGVIGIDTVIGNFHSPITLPSGLGVKFIEVNPRVNGHNQERMFVQLVAERDNLDSTQIHHARIGINREKFSFDSRDDVIQLMTQMLSIKHFDQDMTSENPQFYVDCLHPWKSLYDGILVYGTNSQAIEAVVQTIFEAGFEKKE